MPEVKLAPLEADCVWVIDDPEYTFCPDDLSDLFDGFGPQDRGPTHIGVSKTVAKLWAVNVPIEFDEEGDPEEWEIRFYDTKEEADEALANAKAPV